MRYSYHKQVCHQADVMIGCCWP